MNSFLGMTTAEWVTAVTALLAAIFSIIAAVDPNNFLAKPTLEQAISAAFAVLVPILIAVWAGLHAHATATAAVIKAGKP